MTTATKENTLCRPEDFPPYDAPDNERLAAALYDSDFAFQADPDAISWDTATPEVRQAWIAAVRAAARAGSNETVPAAQPRGRVEPEIDDPWHLAPDATDERVAEYYFGEDGAAMLALPLRDLYESFATAYQLAGGMLIAEDLKVDGWTKEQTDTAIETLLNWLSVPSSTTAEQIFTANAPRANLTKRATKKKGRGK